MFCIHCGAQIEDDSLFCPECGKRQDEAPEIEHQGIQAPDTALQPPLAQSPVLSVTPAATLPKKASLVPYVAAGLVAALVAFGVAFSLLGGNLPFVPSAKTADEALTADTSELVSPAESAGDKSDSSESSSAENSQAAQESTSTQPDTATAQTPDADTPKPAPVFGDAQASSTLPGDSVTAYYGPYNVLDGDFGTCWSPARGSFIGEWVEIYAATPQYVHGISVSNGYPKSRDIYYYNNRPSSITVTLSDGYSQTFDLQDLYAEYQNLDFDTEHETTFVRISINAVYRGNKYDDTCIGDIQAY